MLFLIASEILCENGSVNIFPLKGFRRELNFCLYLMNIKILFFFFEIQKNILHIAYQSIQKKERDLYRDGFQGIEIRDWLQEGKKLKANLLWKLHKTTDILYQSWIDQSLTFISRLINHVTVKLFENSVEKPEKNKRSRIPDFRDFFSGRDMSPHSEPEEEKVFEKNENFIQLLFSFSIFFVEKSKFFTGKFFQNLFQKWSRFSSYRLCKNWEKVFSTQFTIAHSKKKIS